ncbi:MAG: transketolase family protein [Candidatus Altiarchaeales archaeon]|nr:transketolase family protein [Candidatus Altiarchaeales archaeon]
MTTELKSTRDAFGDTIVPLGNKHKNLVVLDADLAVSTKSICFAGRFPERFFDAGCAEQNLIGTAAGLALSGKIAVAATYAIFSCRAWEQVRNVVAHDNLDVKIVVSHAGLTNNSDGSSHQSIEDIALMRVVPNMYVVVPADYYEAKKAVEAAVETKGPFYIRLSRSKTPVVFDEKYEFKLGEVVKLRDGKDACIFACGTMVAEALDAAEKLSQEGVSVRVVNVHTIKPLDKRNVLKHARETKVVVTAEEHNVYCGLGSAIAEVLCESGIPLKMIGIRDRFGQSGSESELKKEYGLSSEKICEAVKEILKSRKK